MSTFVSSIQLLIQIIHSTGAPKRLSFTYYYHHTAVRPSNIVKFWDLDLKTKLCRRPTCSHDIQPMFSSIVVLAGASIRAAGLTTSQPRQQDSASPKKPHQPSPNKSKCWTNVGLKFAGLSWVDDFPTSSTRFSLTKKPHQPSPNKSKCWTNVGLKFAGLSWVDDFPTSSTRFSLTKKNPSTVSK